MRRDGSLSDSASSKIRYLQITVTLGKHGKDAHGYSALTFGGCNEHAPSISVSTVLEMSGEELAATVSAERPASILLILFALVWAQCNRALRPRSILRLE